MVWKDFTSYSKECRDCRSRHRMENFFWRIVSR
ncbi:DUF1752 domain-containing protein [Leptospira yasudae]|nr:DUF1752 domain-containing protein [Leptospira yasudae]